MGGRGWAWVGPLDGGDGVRMGMGRILGVELGAWIGVGVAMRRGEAC